MIDTIPQHAVQDSIVFHIPRNAGILDANRIQETVYAQLKNVNTLIGISFMFFYLHTLKLWIEKVSRYRSIRREKTTRFRVYIFGP